MKRLFKKFVIYLCRKDITVDKINKINRYVFFLIIFLLIIIGLNWEINFKSNFSISASINLITWWTLLAIQNMFALFLILFTKNIYKYRTEYIEKLLNEKVVTVAYKDDKFSLGSTYKVDNQYSIYGRYSPSSESNYFNGYWAGNQEIEKEKVFKFVSAQANRKIKLKKLLKIKNE
jgi:hypothetical protein